MELVKDAGIVDAISKVAPGGGLRSGLDRILQARMGALLILGDSPEVLSICSGGFLVDAEFSPQRLYELAKMDGAIVLTSDGIRLARANVHLVPDPRLPTTETGTRHRTAERVARTVDVPVVAVSEELGVITVYRRNQKRQLQPIVEVWARANQALSTLERYKERLERVLKRLSELERSSKATFRDVVLVLQRAELVRRISEEINWYLIELGADGRMLSLQLDELYLDIRGDYDSVISDFLGPCSEDDTLEVRTYLASLDTDDLLDVSVVSEGVAKRARCTELVTALSDDPRDRLKLKLESRGERVLSLVPRLPQSVKEAILERFSNLSALSSVSEFELSKVEGVGPEWAKVIKEFISEN